MVFCQRFSLTKIFASTYFNKKRSLSFTPNRTLVLGFGPLAQNMPLKPWQSDLIQNQYNIHLQHLQINYKIKGFQSNYGIVCPEGKQLKSQG